MNLKTNGSEQIRNLVPCNLKKDGIPEGSGLTVTEPSIRVMAVESDKRSRIKNQESCVPHVKVRLEAYGFLCRREPIGRSSGFYR